MDFNVIKRNKAAALLLTLLSITLLSVIGMGLIGLTLTQSRISMNHYLMTRAFYVARAGIIRAKDELARDDNWAVSDAYQGSITIESSADRKAVGYYTVSVTPADGNNSNTYKVWYVTSSANVDGAKRTITAILETETLARHVLYTDYTITLYGQDKTPDNFSGPIHTNRYFIFDGKPEFDSAVTSSNQYDDYYDEATRTYTQGGKTYIEPDKFYHYTTSYEQDKPVAKEGANSFYFSGGQPVKTLPSSTQAQYENSNIVFEGDIKITFLDGGQMEITSQSGDETTTAIYSTDFKTVYASGEIYLEGTLSGNVTVVGDKNVYITDHILYDNKAVDSLAIIAKEYIVLATDPDEQRDIHINAMLFSLNKCFYVINYWEGNPRGNIYLYGGLVQKYSLPTGTYDSSTGELKTGFARQFTYDSRFLNKPPKNVPVTGNVIIKTWKDEAAIGN